MNSTVERELDFSTLADDTRKRSSPLPGWPVFADDEIAAVASVLRSGKVNYWTGQEARSFEREYAEYCGVKHAIALANGTVALELALHVLGIGEGDEVVVAPRTFMASASCVVLRGAKPVFADVDPVSQNITAETIRAVLTPRTKAIIAVHLAGWPCEMEPIMALAHEHGLKVIEDCAQAHGALYKSRPVGSFGDINAFSFCQDKIITTGGEGGLLTTNADDLWEKAWAYKDHGKSYDAVYHRQHQPGYRWLHESFGTNWRITEMQAVIGRLQLRKLPDWVSRRRRNAAILTECLRDLPGIRVTLPAPHIGHSYYKYYAFIEPQRLRQAWNRDRIVAAINGHGIPCYTGSCSELYLEKAFAGLEPPQRLPMARQLGDTSLMLLVHPTLGDADMDDTCRAVESVFRAAAR